MRYQNSGCSRGRVCGLVLILLGALALSEAKAQTLTTLVNFNFGDGAAPFAGLIADANGNLFGTTEEGGASGFGTVFEVPYNATTKSYESTPITLVSFNSGDGETPTAGLVADANGNLFGTTSAGGKYGYGTVFEVPYNATTGYNTTLTTLVNFDNSTHGGDPWAGLILDASGNLFGTTEAGGLYGVGTVFEVPYNATTKSYESTPTTLVSFDGSTYGGFPLAGLIADSNGNLFGTTSTGGVNSYGTVFEVPYNATTKSYESTPILLMSFNETDGAGPYGGLIADASGNLFGTTEFGGVPGYGTVFELQYDPTTGYNTKLTTLVNFNGTDGAGPWPSLIADANGNLFGTTENGAGASYYGTVYEVPYNSATGYNTTPITLAGFDLSDGGYLFGGLIADANGNLFGTTFSGGTSLINTASGDGTVFELSGSGFVPPAQFAGKPGTINCAGVSTSTLAHTYGGLAHAATGLHFTSVDALESAITSYCSQ